MPYAMFTTAELPLNADARKERRALRPTLDAMPAKRVRVHVFARSGQLGPFVRTVTTDATPACVSAAIRNALDATHGSATHVAIEVV